jgi:hypothetical protein
MMIELQGGISVGGGVIIGNVPVNPVFFITEDDNNLISETGQYFIAEQYE